MSRRHDARCSVLARACICGRLHASAPTTARPESRFRRPFVAPTPRRQPPAPSRSARSHWWSVFPDPDLQALIRTALDRTTICAWPCSASCRRRAQVTVAGSLPYPDGRRRAQRALRRLHGFGPAATCTPDNSFVPQLGLGAAWEIDFWGKFRRNTESAWADLLAAEDARYAVMATLVTEVGQAYLTLAGAGPDAGNLQAHGELAHAVARPRAGPARRRRGRHSRPAAGRDAVLQRDQDDPRDPASDRGDREPHQRSARTQPGADHSAAGRSTSRSPHRRCRRACRLDLLTRRPDIRQAEQRLISANAQIGVAKADLYPRVTISGFGGAGSATISGSNFGPYWILSVLPEITVPVFNMGRLQANVDYNEAEAKAAGLRYQQTLRQALREVSDALVAIRKRQEFRQQQELLVKALDGREPGRQHALRGRRVELPGSPGYRAAALRRGDRSWSRRSATSR